MSQQKTSPWWQVNAVAGRNPELLLYSAFDEAEGETFTRELMALDADEIDVRINSPGGSTYQGTAIFNALKRHPAQINVFIDGIAFSMASVVAMAGDLVVMAENALLMIHNPLAPVFGESAELRAKADVLDKIGDTIVSAYTSKSGQSLDQVREWMAAETYFSAQEALSLGFVDAIGQSLEVAALHASHIPARLRAFSHPLSGDPGMGTYPVSAGVPSAASNTPQAGGTPSAQPPVAKAPPAAAATLQQLEAMCSDADFVVHCLKHELTYVGSLECLNEWQQKQIADQQSIIADYETGKTPTAALRPDQLEQGTSTKYRPKKQPAADAAAAPAQGQAPPDPSRQVTQDPPAQGQQTDPAAIGNVPLAPAPLQSGVTPPPWGESPVAFFQSELKKAKQELKAQAGGKAIHPQAALREVYRKYPDLSAAIQAQGQPRK